MALHDATAGAVSLYLEAAGHVADEEVPLFEPVSNNIRGTRVTITPSGLYQTLAKYAATGGIKGDCAGPHALRATDSTNALEHNADIAKVKQ